MRTWKQNIFSMNKTNKNTFFFHAIQKAFFTARWLSGHEPFQTVFGFRIQINFVFIEKQPLKGAFGETRKESWFLLKETNHSLRENREVLEFL